MAYPVLEIEEFDARRFFLIGLLQHERVGEQLEELVVFRLETRVRNLAGLVVADHHETRVVDVESVDVSLHRHTVDVAQHFVFHAHEFDRTRLFDLPEILHALEGLNLEVANLALLLVESVDGLLPFAHLPALAGQLLDRVESAFVGVELVEVLEHFVHEGSEVGGPRRRFLDAVDA